MTLLQPGWRSGKRQVNGMSLHVVEAGPVDGPLLILLHGFPEFWWAWRHQITPLAERGYHVVVPDMRGYNERVMIIGGATHWLHLEEPDQVNGALVRFLK